MKNPLPTLLFLLFGGMLFSLQSCGEAPTKKVEYIHTKGDQSVQLRILNGSDYLIYDTPTLVDFEWTNIDPSTAIIGGAGIKMLGNSDGISKTEFTVTKDKLKTDTLHITILFKKDNKRMPAAFHVPVRAKE